MGRKRKKKQPCGDSSSVTGAVKGEGSGPSNPPKKRIRYALVEQDINDSGYFFEKGLRKVHPYYFKFQTHCKGRWVGKMLRDVYEKEFRTASPEYWAAALQLGRVTLNGEPTSLDAVITHNDVLAHTVHRHEHPVSDAKIDIVFDDNDVLVVNKPSSLPIHPSGRFRHNSLTHILYKEYGYKNLHTIHRLDRLTSGIVIFAKTLLVSQKLDKLVRERSLHKEYVCRVDGIFPSKPIVCTEPIKVMSHKVGLCHVHPDGKESETIIELLHTHTDGQTSILKCLPRTGRMHQIRVHLLHLGYPILNDPLYNQSIWKQNASDEEIVKNLQDSYQHSVQRSDQQGTTEQPAGCSGNGVKSERGDVEGSADTKQEKSNSTDNTASGRADYDSICLDCKKIYKDPEPDELIMYLHALKYKGPDFEYETAMPTWAQAKVDDEDVSIPKIKEELFSEPPLLIKSEIKSELLD